ncbi:MAG: MFS transporter [Terriglobales bacterium]
MPSPAIPAPLTEPITVRRRWMVMSLLSLATFINYLDRGSIGVAMPVMKGELHLSPWQQGLVFSSFFWTYAAMQIPMGWLVDRMAIKWLYAGAFALWSLAAAATGLAQGILSLLVLRVLLGIGESIYLPGGVKVVSRQFPPDKRTLPSGFFDLGAKLGLAAATFLDAWLLIHYGWRSLFFRTGGLGLLWLLPWVWLYPGRADTQGPPRVRSPRRTTTLFKDRALLGLCLGFFCWDYFWYFLVFWLPSYLVAVRHISLSQLKFIGALPYLIMAATEAIGGGLANRWIGRGRDRSLVTKGLIAVGLAFGLFVLPAAYAATTQSAVLFLCLASLSGLLTANILVVPQYCAPPDQVALWTGIQNFWGNVGGVIAPALTGYLVGRTGSYLSAFVCAAALLVAGIVAYVFVVPHIELPRAAETAGTL